MTDFERHVREHYTQVLPGMKERATAAGVNVLEMFGLRLEYVLLKHQEMLHATDRTEFLAHLAVKVCQQIQAYVACLRGGQLEAGYHHIRTVIEVRAALHYVCHDPAAEAERLKKFQQWPWASAYLDFERWERLRKKHAGDAKVDEWCTRAQAISGKIHAQVEQPLRQSWADLYVDHKNYKTPEKRLAQFDDGYVNAWHAPASMQKMIETIRTKDVEGWLRCYDSYGVACNGTHFSPLSKSLSANNRNMNFYGWDDEISAMAPTFDMADFALATADEIDDFGAFNFKKEWEVERQSIEMHGKWCEELAQRHMADRDNR